MKIAFRTSGGRGEYELAGRQGATSVGDLFDYSFDFQVSPYILVPGHCSLRKHGGKPRIRLEGDPTATHAYRWLSALLLLPKPNRVRSAVKTSGSTLHLSSGYQVSGIRVDIASSEESHCTLRPTILELHQGENERLLSVPERMGRIQNMLAEKDKLPEALASLLSDYEEATKGDISHKALEQIRTQIYEGLQEAGGGSTLDDALDALEALLPQTEQIAAQAMELQLPASITPDGENDERSAIEVRADFIRAWRLVAERGHKGRKFSREVMEAYDTRCIVSGSRLPRTPANPTPGVDAAHILPWAKYDLDKVTNGVCLAKTYHWAFDSAILRIAYDHAANRYVVSMEDATRQVLSDAGCDLDLFMPHLGAIPEDRLPANLALRPDPAFLDEFNKQIALATP